MPCEEVGNRVVDEPAARIIDFSLEQQFRNKRGMQSVISDAPT
jgi:hypothetical protein